MGSRLFKLDGVYLMFADSTFRSVAIGLFILMASSFSRVHAQGASPGAAAYGTPPAGWLADYSNEIEQQLSRFSAAYSLDENATEALRAKLVGRLQQQWEFEADVIARVTKAAEDAAASGGEPDPTTTTDLLQSVVDNGPLSDKVVAQEIETQLDPQFASEGRGRLDELLKRRDLMLESFDTDIEQQAQHNGDLASARIGGDATATAQGNPLPNGAKLAEVAPAAVGKAGGETPPSTPVRPNAAMQPGISDVGIVPAMGATPAHSATGADMDEVRAAADELLNDPTKSIADVKGAATNGRTAKAAARKIGAANAEKPAAPVAAAPVAAARNDANRAEKNPGPSRPMPAAVEPVRLQAAPALDDWDKYVDTTCKKFEFTDAQVIKAQSILKDLRNRARAYRNSRDDDFAAAERLTDAKAKADRKKELNTPIDAFFEELKQRLDNLATLEQRAKAAAPTAGKK